MKQLMEMKAQADRIKKELDNATVEADAGLGIRIIISGSQNFRSFEIDEALVRSGDKAGLQKALLKSANEAIRRSQQLAAQKMKDVMPGFPGG